MPSNLSEMKRTRDGNVSSPERLAYWYLRLNGFLLLENFVIHPDQGNDQRTDADLLGVRFAHRAENPVRPMADDPVVTDCSTFCNVVIAEVKKGRCALNGPWTKPKEENIQRVLCAIGCFPESAVNLAAGELYSTGLFTTENVTCRLLAFGDHRAESLPIAAVPQILFNDMIRFIQRRFSNYIREKSSVGNWTWEGQELRHLAENNVEMGDFVKSVRALFGLGDHHQ